MTATTRTPGTPAPATASPVPGRRALRIGRVSTVLRWRPLFVMVAGLAALAVIMCANLARGDIPLHLTEVVRVLLGAGDPMSRYVVMELRVPRSLTGALVGAALGLSGALMQTLARNPLASPEVLGVTYGGSAAVVAVIAAGGSYGAVSGVLAGIGVPAAGLLGGLLAAGLVHALAWRRGIDDYRLLLVGIGISTALLQVTFWLLTLGEVSESGRALVWITGSLNNRGWEHVYPVSLALLVLLPLCLLGDRTLGALRYDDDTSRALGVRVRRSRSALLLVSVALASVATAAAGPVAFVALAVPQIGLRLARVARPPLLISTVYGALLTVAADLLARTAFAVELPVGIVTGVLGAGYLLILLTRRYRKAPV